MKVAIVGRRQFKDSVLLERTLKWLRIQELATEIISGGAEGADTLAAEWARQHGVSLREIKPDYTKYAGNPKFAPIARNMDIVHEADLVIAFWDGVREKGTWNVIQLALEKSKQLVIIPFSPKVKNVSFRE